MTEPRWQHSAWHTVRHGLALTPGLATGLGVTLGLALVATLGRVAIPIVVQQVIDRAILIPNGPDIERATQLTMFTALVIMITLLAAYVMNVRLFVVGENALVRLRTRAFRHIHDLSMLHQQSERRGALVSRVTGDIDTVSQFLQWGGLLLLVAGCQLLVATAVMAVYSWQLTLLVLACFVPVAWAVPRLQRRLAATYGRVRERAAQMLAAISETVVGAPVVRAFGIADRTVDRIDTSIEAYRREQTHAQRLSVFAFSAGELAAGFANVVIVIAGVLLGIDGQLTIGELAAFLFLVTLFIAPVQLAMEVLNDAQNAVAGYRRVLQILDIKPDIADPAHGGRELPPGPIAVKFVHVRFAYPGGPEVLHDVSVQIAARSKVAIVGETGSGKTTFVKLLTRLLDPTDGQVLLSEVPLQQVSFSSLRQRVVLVPQDSFLFTTSIAENVRYGRTDITDAQIELAFAELGLSDWLAGLPGGLATEVGERGESLSVGERQLVGIARAYVVDPDLLVLDEATSSVDPATEVRLARALDTLTRGRTAVTIAHRMGTAEAADEVLVFDDGRIAQRGTHADLVADTDSIYARLYDSWIAQTR